VHWFPSAAYSGLKGYGLAQAYTPGIAYPRTYPGVTGQNIPPAGVYPDILWPRPIYTPGYI